MPERELKFTYLERWAQPELRRRLLADDAGEWMDALRALEDRDRDLEDYLSNLSFDGQRPGTVTVAASNSRLANRNAADFVCTGTADQVIIQDAVNAVPSSGGSVFFYEGTYNFSGGVQLGGKPILVVGTGKGTVFSVNNANAFTSSSSSTTVDLQQTFRDFKVVGAGGTSRLYSVTNGNISASVYDVDLVSLTDGVFFAPTGGGGKRSIIQGCRFISCGNGVDIDQSVGDIWIDGCLFESCTNGVYRNGPAASGPGAMTVTGSVFISCGWGINHNKAGQSSHLYAGNYFRSCSSGAVRVTQFALAQSEFTHFTANEVVSCPRGFEVESLISGASVIGNRFTLCSTRAVRLLSSGTVIANYFGDGGVAVRLDGNSNSVLSNHFKSNTTDVQNLGTGNIIGGNAGGTVTNVPLRYAVSIGDGVNTSFTVTHGLGTLDVIVQIVENSTGGTVMPLTFTRDSTTQCTVTFAVAPSSNEYRVVVLA